jgi:hypothetical protein
MFAITLIAVGAAVAAWLRPIPEVKPASPSAPTFNDRQVADAKSKVCAAYEKFTTQALRIQAEAAATTPPLNWRWQ